VLLSALVLVGGVKMMVAVLHLRLLLLQVLPLLLLLPVLLLLLV